MEQKNRLILFAALFFAAIIADFIKFKLAGDPSVINWHSFVHPAWVIGAATSVLLSAYFPVLRTWFFGAYLSIFAASYVNIYIPFSETLTYFCMLFNLVLVVAYLLSRDTIA